MFIVLTLVGLLIVGIVCIIINEKTWCCPDWVLGIGIGLTFVSSIVLTPVIGVIISIRTQIDIDYQNKLYEKEMLEYRIEHLEENITGNEMLYNDIVEFNNDLRSVKKWANNPWTNWFNNERIATIEYIELEDFKR